MSTGQKPSLSGLDISGMSGLPARLASIRHDHLLSICDPDDRKMTDRVLASSEAEIARLDIREPLGRDWSHRLKPDMVDEVCLALNPWLNAPPGELQLLVHCRMGERRSTAFGWALLCLRSERQGIPYPAAGEFLRLFEGADPGRVIIETIAMSDAFEDISIGDLFRILEVKIAAPAKRTSAAVKHKKRLFRV